MLGGHTHKAILLFIDSLARSAAAAEFARSASTLATAEDAAVACSAGHFEDIRTKTETGRYLIKDGYVVVEPAERFSKTDD
jgi:hypothetical protein